MFTVNVQVIGVEKISSYIDKAGKNIDEAIDANVEKLIKPVEEEAKLLCPVSKPPFKPTFYHGALRDSIHSKRVGKGVGMISDGVFYGVYQELGYYHWKGGQWIQNPFLFPALQIAFPQVTEQVKILVNSVTEKIKAKGPKI